MFFLLKFLFLETFYNLLPLVLGGDSLKDCQLVDSYWCILVSHSKKLQQKHVEAVVLMRKVKLIGPISRPMGLLFKALGKTPSAGLPYARDGVLPFNGVPTACPFWVGDPLARSGGRSRARDVEIVGNAHSLPSRGFP